MKNKIVLIIAFVMVFACDDIIEVTDISENTVNALAPTNGTILTDINVTFTWDAIEDAVNYKIQIATPSFEEAIQIVTDSTLTSTLFSETLDSGNYEWRIRAENSGSVTNYTAQKFVLVAADPIDISDEQVVLLAPADNTTFLTTDTINFSWEGVEDADQYTIQIATPSFSNATEIIEDETTTSTSFSISNLIENTYEWRVKATNSGYETGYTSDNFSVSE